MSDALERLKQDGIAILDHKIPAPLLQRLQESFSQQITHRRWNTNDGFQQNERWRLLVEDLFLVDPAFAQVAFDEDTLDILDSYFEETPFILTEARGWQTTKTKKQFHNWHNDAWYDTSLPQIPPQIKLGVYLTDVESGYFSYVAGTHKHQLRPNHWNDKQVAALDLPVIDVIGPAGTLFLFNTSGIHRQTTPVLTPRNALMFNYHDPHTPIQALDQTYGRYQPVRIDVNGLTILNDRQKDVLGINAAAQEQHLQQPSLPRRRFRLLHVLFDAALSMRLTMQDMWNELLRPVHGIRRRLPSRRS